MLINRIAGFDDADRRAVSGSQDRRRDGYNWRLLVLCIRVKVYRPGPLPVRVVTAGFPNYKGTGHSHDPSTFMSFLFSIQLS